MKLKVFGIWILIICINLIITYNMNDLIAEIILQENNITLNNTLLFTMTFLFLTMASFMDIIILTFIVHVTSVLVNKLIKTSICFFLGSLFSLILNFNQLVLNLMRWRDDTLELNDLTLNIFQNPFFYIGLILIGLYMYKMQSVKLSKVIIILVVIAGYKLLSSFLF